MALPYGLLGDDEAFRLWRARAVQVTGRATADRYRHLTFATFVDARVAVHTQDLTEAADIVHRAFDDAQQGWFSTYAQAAAAELAIVAGLPEAERHLTAAMPAADENDWAAACLARARGSSNSTRQAMPKPSPPRSSGGSASAPASNAPAPSS